MAALMAKLNATWVLVTAARTGQIRVKRLAAFTTELHAIRIISLTLRALHQRYPTTNIQSTMLR